MVSYHSAFSIGGSPPSSRTPEEFSTASGYAGGPTIFFVAEWEKGNREKFLPPRLFRSLVQVRGSSSIQRESRVQASDPEGSSLAILRVATSSTPRTTSRIRDADVCAASEIGWALSTCTRETIAIKRLKGLSSDWQDLEECARKHLKSS